jgi:hypothetical protein
MVEDKQGLFRKTEGGEFRNTYRQTKVYDTAYGRHAQIAASNQGERQLAIRSKAVPFSSIFCRELK